MSLEFEADVQIDIQPEVEVEVEIDMGAEVEIEIEAEVDAEIEIEAEVDAEIEIEVEVPCVEVEIVADVDFNADLVVESNLDEPIVEVEIGGSSNTKVHHGGVCNLVCSIIFLCFGIADLVSLICLAVSWNYYAESVMRTYNYNRIEANTTLTWSIVCLSTGAFLWAVLTMCCCKCWKTAKNVEYTSTNNCTVEFESNTRYEVGGGANVDVEFEVEAPCVEIEVEIEAPVFEVEVEFEAPEIEIEVEAEIEIEVEAEIELEAEIEVEAGVEVELEVEL